jgi:hypothetical protein
LDRRINRGRAGPFGEPRAFLGTVPLKRSEEIDPLLKAPLSLPGEAMGHLSVPTLPINGGSNRNARSRALSAKRHSQAPATTVRDLANCLWAIARVEDSSWRHPSVLSMLAEVADRIADTT